MSDQLIMICMQGKIGVAWINSRSGQKKTLQFDDIVGCLYADILIFY